MRKFLILLNKEIRELLTAQVIAPLLITAAIFFFLGNIMDKEQEKAGRPVDIAVIDEDQSTGSAALISMLRSSGTNVFLSDEGLSNALETAKKDQKKVALLKIPAGYGEGLAKQELKQVEIYTFIRNFSMMGGRSYGNMMTAVGKTNEIISNQLISTSLPSQSVPLLKNPIKPNEFTVVGDKTANVSPGLIMGFVSQQSTLIPIILFFVIVFSSQMIATAIANEKENKTLETLLTTPVSRNSIVIAKMAGAGIIALLASIVYIIGFRSYTGGLGGGAEATSQVNEIIRNLGLSLAPESYILLGISLFFGILFALSLSLILGSFAEDVKGVAGLTTPVMVFAMVPYILTLFLDINTLSPAVRNIVYLIPFSHVFLATPNLFLHNYSAVIFGIAYQAVWFLITVYIAAKIFSTDKIVTLKLNFGKKK